MLQREFKINFKSLLIWTTIISVTFLLVFILYPVLINTNNVSNLDELIKVFPKELLIAFNMDIISMSISLGFLQSEGITLLMLIYGVYASILGGTILLKEESDKTIEFLYSKPINKNKIVTNKLIIGTINILILNIVTSIIISIGLYLNNEIIIKGILLNSITLLPTILIFIFMMFISTFYKKTRKITGICFGFVFLEYFLLTFSNINEKVNFLKFFSVYSLTDLRNIVINNSYNFIFLIIFILLFILFTLGTYIKYNSKEYC